MEKLRFGTAGIPLSTERRDTVNGISKVKELGLGAMELEFVRSINISADKAPEIKQVSKKEEIVLTCHAPYFINLNAIEPEKVHASINRIVKSAEILEQCGGYSVCFHPGFYLGMEKPKVLETIGNKIKEIRKILDDRGIGVWLRPETTGKETQFGSYEELLKISQANEKVMPVFDFSHVHARTGRYNTYPEFTKILGSIESYLGKEGLENMHIHVSGIAYSEKGEKHHLNLKESDLRYEELIKAWRDFNIKGVVISESPNIEEDALLMRSAFEGTSAK